MGQVMLPHCLFRSIGSLVDFLRQHVKDCVGAGVSYRLDRTNSLGDGLRLSFVTIAAEQAGKNTITRSLYA